MESIPELRKICQTTAKKDTSNIYMRYVSRFLSIYLTRLLIPTKATPNQVSFAMIVTGAIACCLFVYSDRWIFLAAAILLQLWYILDCMDGELARYRQYVSSQSVVTDKRQSGMAGAYYDIINHYIINFLVPIMLGYGLYLNSWNVWFLNLGIIASLGQVLMLAMHDGRSRIMLNHINRFDEIIVRKTVADDKTGKKRSPMHWAFMILHYSMTYPTVMNLVLVAAVLNVLIPAADWRIYLIGYLAFGSAVVTAIFITRTIARRTTEEEFQARYDVDASMQPEMAVSGDKNPGA